MIKKSLRKTAIAMALATLAGPSMAVLSTVDPGPYTAATGFFPLFYGDAANTNLDLCLSKAVSSRTAPVPGAPAYMCTLLPNPGVFDDTKPIVFAFNFPDESFYFTADAVVTGQNVDLTYIAHLEAAFGGPQGLPAPGDQITFARIRLVPRNLPVAGTYTVTHPYGVDTIVVTTPGRQTQITRDIGVGAAGVFTGALGGDIGPFLRSVNGPYTETNPETGTLETFVGDPNLTEPVLGGPNGNIVRIQGPGGIDVQTNLFSVSGRLWNNQRPTPLAVDRSTYTRDANGTRIDVFASSSATASACFRESVDLVAAAPPAAPSPCLVNMAADGNGISYGRDPAPATLPPFVVVTATDPGVTTPTPLASALVDVVNISRAEFDKATGTLRVHAASSDQVLRPTLSLVGLGNLTPAGGTNTQVFVRTGMAEPPAFVTVTSSAGGRDTEPVAVVTAAPANLPPVAVADTAATNEDSPVSVAVLANDSDPDLDPLTVIGVGAPLNGTATTNGTTVTYTPNANFSGSDIFSYTISDGRGGTSSASVTVTVNPVNDAPIAVADALTTAEDTPITVTAASLLANDSDIDGPSALAITAVGGAVNGTVVRNAATGDITFTPAPNFNGAARFTYTVSDGLATATGTVNVTVTPVNDIPVAVNDTASTQAPNAVVINVLANDSDPDNLPPAAANAGLTVTNLTPVTGVGSLVLNANQTVTFTPAANFSGAATFTYRALDGGGSLSNTATVTVNVTPAVNGVDLDISRFTATAIQRVGRTVIFNVRVVNRTAINQPGSATLVGVQNGETVYSQTRVASDPPGGGDTVVPFPNFVPTQTGRIDWALTLTDGNPDIDSATATTNVIQ